MLYILNYIYYFTYISELNRIKLNRIKSNHLNVSTLLSNACTGDKNHLLLSCLIVSKNRKINSCKIHSSISFVSLLFETDSGLLLSKEIRLTNN